MKVACFGDSWTFGYDVKTNETWPYNLQKINIHIYMKLNNFNWG